MCMILCVFLFFFFFYIFAVFIFCFFFFFFFSSRRRHTRWTGDWSSDVCSSDLAASPTRLANVQALRGVAALLVLGMHAVGRQVRSFGAEGVAMREAARVRSEERRVGKECRSRWSPHR